MVETAEPKPSQFQRTCVPDRPRREPYFLSSHVLYLTSQRTKLGDLLCFGILDLNNGHCKRNGTNRLSGWRDIQLLLILIIFLLPKDPASRSRPVISYLASTLTRSKRALCNKQEFLRLGIIGLQYNRAHWKAAKTVKINFPFCCSRVIVRNPP